MGIDIAKVCHTEYSPYGIVGVGRNCDLCSQKIKQDMEFKVEKAVLDAGVKNLTTQYCGGVGEIIIPTVV